MNERELKERTKRFALRVMRLTGSLPKTVEGRALANQLIRSGTSVGANYRAACRARSRADFVAKLAIAEEEADESAYWMELIAEGGLMPPRRVEPLHREADELVAILTASRKTAGQRANQKSKIKNQKSRAAGLSLVEMLLALVIASLLLTATTVALNASFHAYATAAESASTQSSSRLVMQRLLGMIRTTSDHGAIDTIDDEPDDAYLPLPTPQPPARSLGIIMFDNDDNLVRVCWAPNAAYEDEGLGDLWFRLNNKPPQPLLERVRAQRDAEDQPYIFSLAARPSARGRVLSRATVDLEVSPGADATLSLESARGASAAIRMVGSAVPRRNLR